MGNAVVPCGGFPRRVKPATVIPCDAIETIPNIELMRSSQTIAGSVFTPVAPQVEAPTNEAISYDSQDGQMVILRGSPKVPATENKTNIDSQKSLALQQYFNHEAIKPGAPNAAPKEQCGTCPRIIAMATPRVETKLEQNQLQLEDDSTAVGSQNDDLLLEELLRSPLYKEATVKFRDLLGWEVFVHSEGIGHVTKVNLSRSGTYTYMIQFQDGRRLTIPLECKIVTNGAKRVSNIVLLQKLK